MGIAPRRRQRYESMCRTVAAQRLTTYAEYRIELLIPFAHYFSTVDARNVTDLSTTLKDLQTFYKKKNCANDSEEELRKALLSDSYKYVKSLENPGAALFELGRFFASLEIQDEYYRASWLGSVDDCAVELHKLIARVPSAQHQGTANGPSGYLVAVQCDYAKLLQWLQGCLATGIQAAALRRQEEFQERFVTTTTAHLYVPRQFGLDFILSIKISSFMARALREATSQGNVLEALVGPNIWQGMKGSHKAQVESIESCIEICSKEPSQDWEVRVTIDYSSGKAAMTRVYGSSNLFQ